MVPGPDEIEGGHEETDLLDREGSAKEQERGSRTMHEPLQGEQQEQQSQFVEAPRSNGVERPAIEAPKERAEKSQQRVTRTLHGQIQENCDRDVGDDPDGPPNVEPRLVLTESQLVDTGDGKVEEGEVRGVLGRTLVQVRGPIVRIRIFPLRETDSIAPDVVDIRPRDRRRPRHEPRLAEHQHQTEDEGQPGGLPSDREPTCARDRMRPLAIVDARGDRQPTSPDPGLPRVRTGAWRARGRVPR